MHVNRIGFQCVMLLAVASLLAGCSKDPAGVKVKVTKDNLCAEVAEVMCDNVFKCCTGQEIEDYFGVEITTSESACRRDMELVCKNTYATRIHSIKQQRLKVIEDKVEACLEALLVTGDECFPVVTGFAPECDAVKFKGNQSNNAACLYSFECAADSYCATNRICNPKARLNMPCGQDEECASGLYCIYDEVVEENTCQNRIPVGGECEYRSTNASNINERQCAESYLCMESPGGGSPSADGGDPDVARGICSARLPLNAPCDSHNICASGYCLALEDCVGSCEHTGASCLTVTGCESSFCSNLDYPVPCDDDDGCGVCEDSGDRCEDDDDCRGSCSASSAPCDDDSDCPTESDGGTNTCVSDSCSAGDCDVEECIPTGDCAGDPICAERYTTISYCNPTLYGRVFSADPMDMMMAE